MPLEKSKQIEYIIFAFVLIWTAVPCHHVCAMGNNLCKCKSQPAHTGSMQTELSLDQHAVVSLTRKTYPSSQVNG